MDMERALGQLGLTRNEISVYLALFRLGTSKAGRIAKECSLERTSAYNALKRLLEKGIISSVRQGAHQVFSAGTPEKLLSMVDEQKEIASMVIPGLHALKKVQLEKESVLKFRRYSGVKTVMMDTLETCKPGEEYLILGAEGQVSERMPTFAKIYIAKKDGKNLKARVLTRKTRGNVLSKTTAARYLPKEIGSLSSLSIYGGKVSLIIWGDTPEAIIIDNPEVAQTFRNYFEFMWKHAEK